MLALHPQARTTPAVRGEIAGSREPSGVLAQRYGVSTETVRTIYSHRDLETLLTGFNQAYNGRRQRVLQGASPRSSRAKSARSSANPRQSAL